ncbi:MAG: hypothetical protein PQJ60_01115 [Spirochaetales bacterium]|nr:hypothetical protein [Spirochaetales bacterium]
MKKHLPPSSYLLSCFLIFLLLPFLLAAQDREEYETARELMGAVDRAVALKHYEQALTLLEEGKRSYPGDNRFPARAGELYMDQKLFSLALEEFNEAAALDATAQIRFQLSRVHGFLDNNEESARYLEGLLDDSVYRSDALADLGWMYFKLHRLAEGEALMREALEEGFNRTYAHTLGTIYSGLYDYEKSRSYYLRAVENALAGSDNYFAAVAYYNLSLLEMAFYRYDRAREYTALSLEQVDRPSGHVALGELLQLSLDYARAREEFLAAYALNRDSPLALLDLADLNREFGYLEESLVQLRELRARKDNSWMYYYGINREEWDLDITQVFRDVYLALLRESRVKPRWGITGRLTALGERIQYAFLYRYHRGRFRKLCRSLGQNQLDENNPFPGWRLLAEGARGYGRTALHYWTLAEEFETALAPHGAPWYDLRKGRDADRADLLYRGYEAFFIPAENAPRAEALGELLRLLRRGGVTGKERQEYLRLTGELYRLNRGALRQRGLVLPLIIQVRGVENRSLSRKLRRLHRGADAKNSSLCYHLHLIVREGEETYWYLEDPGGTTAREGRFTTPPLDRKGKRFLIERIENELYGAKQ